MEKKNKIFPQGTIEFKVTKISFHNNNYVLPIEGEDYMVLSTSYFSSRFIYNITPVRTYIKGEFHGILPEKELLLDKEEYMEIEYYEEPNQ